jgi:hypothetical protein
MKTSIVSIFRDEAKFLKEWIEFHRIIGVDKFYLVNNNSSDNFLEILEPYIKQNIVVLSNISVETSGNGNGIQNENVIVNHWIQELNRIIKSCDDDWVIHVSIDEFLYPTHKNNIKEILGDYDNNVGEISVNWVLFGNNNYTLKPNELLIEKLTKSSHNDYLHNFHVKFIIKPKAVLHIPSVHFGFLKPGYVRVDSKGNTNNFKSKHETYTWVGEPLVINHYRLRDLDWTEKKLKMYEHWGRTDFNSLRNYYNDVDNFNILRFVNELKDRIES